MKYVYIALYIASIIAANILIAAIGPVVVGFGLLAPAGVYVAGLSLWLRDAVQERAGRGWAVAAVFIGAAFSAALSPTLAVASGVAFLISELVDMAVYTPLRRRGWAMAVATSNAVGLVVDGVLFLWLAFGALDYLPGQIVGKLWAMAAVIVIGVALRKR